MANTKRIKAKNVKVGDTIKVEGVTFRVEVSEARDLGPNPSEWDKTNSHGFKYLRGGELHSFCYNPEDTVELIKRKKGVKLTKAQQKSYDLLHEYIETNSHTVDLWDCAQTNFLWVYRIWQDATGVKMRGRQLGKKQFETEHVYPQALYSIFRNAKAHDDRFADWLKAKEEKEALSEGEAKTITPEQQERVIELLTDCITEDENLHDKLADVLDGSVFHAYALTSYLSGVLYEKGKERMNKVIGFAHAADEDLLEVITVDRQ